MSTTRASSSSSSAAVASDTGFADEVAAAVRARLLVLAGDFHAHHRRLTEVGTPADLAGLMVTVVPVPSPWDDAVGPFYLGDQARRLLGGITRQALAERRSRRTLLALRTADDEWVYPLSQFDLVAGEVPDALGPVLKAFDTWDVDEWTIAAWLQRPLRELEGTSVLEWLRTGREPTPALAAAQRCSSGLRR